MHDMRGKRQKERNEESSRHNACAAATQPSSKRIAFMIQDLHLLSFTIMNMHDRRHDDIQVSTMCFVRLFKHVFGRLLSLTYITHARTYSLDDRSWMGQENKKRKRTTLRRTHDLFQSNSRNRNNIPTCLHDNFGRGFVLPAPPCILRSGGLKVLENEQGLRQVV